MICVGFIQRNMTTVHQTPTVTEMSPFFILFCNRSQRRGTCIIQEGYIFPLPNNGTDCVPQGQKGLSYDSTKQRGLLKSQVLTLPHSDTIIILNFLPLCG